jgi:hypothetical protein
MENLFGFENMEREAAVMRMIEGYEKEIHETARVSHLLQDPDGTRRAWYCPLLFCLGDRLVALGTYLKARYSMPLRFGNENLKVTWKPR